MKKVSAKFMLTEGVILVAISVIGGLVASYFGGSTDLVSSTIGLGGFLLFLLALFYCSSCNAITGKFAKKTMEEKSKEANFSDYSTFTTNGSFTIGGIVRIDERTGRIAYVSYQNPYEFQLVSAKDVTKVQSSYIKGPFGGTRYVYFEFYYNNKRLRIPTFTSRNMYSLQSTEVLEGISKADAFCEIITNAQKVAI